MRVAVLRSDRVSLRGAVVISRPAAEAIERSIKVQRQAALIEQ